MTAAEAKQLKAGDRIIFHGFSPMGGTVEWNNRLLCGIAWADDTHTIVHHKHIAKFERENDRKHDTVES